jgi:hypothetical protein
MKWERTFPTLWQSPEKRPTANPETCCLPGLIFNVSKGMGKFESISV